MTREEAYDQVAKIAAEYALIAQGFGGVLTIVHPDTQREHGIEAKCLFMAGQGPWPDDAKSIGIEPALARAEPVARCEDQPDLFALLDAEQQEGVA
ncbi:hypothetical protein [Stutzerimonas nitrititolerans]|uniref:hypothetical protein n=1 Tax=Stutzerimonas nitrititolerans TaxID=2482751 RepID=UPI00289FC84E|nr:hypothetical protein [Stutzerimonas nitrititolerans]